MTTNPLSPAPPQREAQVLIAGAGPTGLVLALMLTRQGVRVRIVDPLAQPGTTSRALAIQARTLEFYQQIGLANTVVERGRQFESANLWVAGRKVARIAFGAIGAGMSPFPHLTIFPQDQHERLLIEQLSALGIEVERGTSVASFADAGTRIRVQLARAGGAAESCDVMFLAGCDGAHSKVREGIGATFEGGTYAHTFYVADVDAIGVASDGQLHVALEATDFAAVFPMKGAGHLRIVGAVRPDTSAKESPPTWADVGHKVVSDIGLTVSQVHWFSTYRVHHRVANHFTKGQAFLLGDAAHVHSPVGGQGMNTGIGDAVNLAWKLAAFIHGQADARILATYEPERIAFARQLVHTTDRAFEFVTNKSAPVRWLRLRLIPIVLPILAAFTVVRRFIFRTVSQIGIHYPSSWLSAGHAGRVHAGDRLPWVPLGDDANAAPGFPGPGNFAPLSSLAWQVHVYGDAPAALAERCAARGLPLHAFPWLNAMHTAGLARGASYLIRPDGYVALADPAASPDTLERFLNDRNLLRPPSAA
jgi:2-polyprenyl-6-methoxyphenol hydroxylase-like FAD-dependent oxidoreductase